MGHQRENTMMNVALRLALPSRQHQLTSMSESVVNYNEVCHIVATEVTGRLLFVSIGYKSQSESNFLAC